MNVRACLSLVTNTSKKGSSYDSDGELLLLSSSKMNWDLNVVAPLDEYHQYIYLSQSFVHECSIHAVTGSSIILDYKDDFFKGRISITKMLVWQSPRGTTLTWLYLMILICYNKFLYSLTCICMLMWKSKVKWNSLMKPDEESSQKVTKFLPIYYLSQKSLWIPLTLAVGWKISISIDTSVLTVNLVFTFKRWAKVGVVSQVCQSLYGICDIISKL